MKKAAGKPELEQGLKEMFRQLAEPADPARLEAVRRRVLAGVPTDFPVPAGRRRPVLVLASALSLLILALGAYLFWSRPPAGPLETVSRIVQDDRKLEQFVLLVDELVSREDPNRFSLGSRGENLGVGIFTEDTLLPAAAEEPENGYSLL